MLTKTSKVLVTGCGGMLGEAIYGYFKNICSIYPTDIDINDSWLSYLDVRDYAAVKNIIFKLKPDYIFHLAALTDLEYCEQNPEKAYETNSYGTENIALLCREFNIPLIYITTAGTFDGKQKEYVDYDIPNPISVYGKSKYAGEKIVKKFLARHFIFRPSWMIGGGPKKDKKFVNKIIKQIKEGKKELFVLADKFGTPTYTYDLAKIIHRVIDTGRYGIYNSACEGDASRYDVAKEIIFIKNLQDKIKLTKVSSSFFNKEYFVARPESERLINLKLNLLGINIPRDWRICLREYLNNYDWEI